MSGLRPMTPEELAAPSMFDEYPPTTPSKLRWHCGRCGRFASQVRKVKPHGPDWYDEHEYTGQCRVHGEVDVVWPEQ